MGHVCFLGKTFDTEERRKRRLGGIAEIAVIARNRPDRKSRIPAIFTDYLYQFSPEPMGMYLCFCKCDRLITPKVARLGKLHYTSANLKPSPKRSFPRTSFELSLHSVPVFQEKKLLR